MLNHTACETKHINHNSQLWLIYTIHHTQGTSCSLHSIQHNETLNKGFFDIIPPSLKPDSPPRRGGVMCRCIYLVNITEVKCCSQQHKYKHIVAKRHHSHLETKSMSHKLCTTHINIQVQQ